MTKNDLPKLVRDKIPQIIKKSGSDCETKTLHSRDYRKYLKNKLLEEAEELNQADFENIKNELADVLEVVYTLAKEYSIPLKELERKRKNKKKKRGGFKKMILLEKIIDVKPDS